MYDILNKINSPEDVKKLSVIELKELARDIREALFNRLTKIGGHCAPNFGAVEAEIAMHYVFSSPKDKFVFDVSHQSYPHKMLTGRKAGYIDASRFFEDSGYTNPEESVHDLFNVGHTSTSISLATGLAKAREIRGGTEKIVAFIGDGSLSGGEALEGLNMAGSEIHSNLIIIVNDNQQSISETHGGIYRNLKELRESGGRAENNMFTAWGLKYLYVPDGNDIVSLIDAFTEAKNADRPIVVHINTLKGKGFALAEKNKEAWHWTLPFDRQTGEITVPSAKTTYVQIAREYILNRAKTDETFVAVTPNMPGSFSLSKADRESMGEKFVDVGIAEEQAAAMAAGLAKGGAKPLVFTNVTFMQRAYDQISQDVCINGAHVTFLLNCAAFDSLTDVTHLGIFGLSIFSNIPSLTVLTPASKSELAGMLDWALDKNDGASVILMPGGEVTARPQSGFDGSFRYKTEQKGERLAILALGDFYKRGEEIAGRVKDKFGFTPTLIAPGFASSLDEKTLNHLKNNHELTITLEDGVVDGGFGQKIAAFYGDSEMKVKNYGLKKKFYDRYSPEELLRTLGMDTESVLKDIQRLLRLD
ncbi:MAG: 1-deoxy-D-xylulose-5-phosphate synthase [Candidatus Borkfalkiaceae bacterium]|nr:1-deoxy-D-xylulose-5-phosphate synthase [Clostridia bacterium]MDY6224127.1 1-deoxy-D-xylulose-5-phosphate synthase [Christensenellaceae bacterium]